MKIIHKSILKELLVTFLLTLAFLDSILMMEKLLRLSRLLSGVGASLFDMSKIILYIQPQLLLLTIPMSLLLSTLLVYGRMAQDNEIIVMKSNSMNLMNICLPVIMLGLLCFLMNIFVSFYLGPKSSIKLRDEITRIIAERSTLAIEEGAYNTSFKDIVIIVKGKKSPEILEKIFIYDNRKKEEPKVLLAKEGKLFMQDDFSIGLYLKDGYINITKGRNTTELFFDSYKINLNLENEAPASKKIEFTVPELLQKAMDASTYRKRASLLLEFHRRLSLPSVCLLLIFLGPPLSLIAGKSGRLGGLALGLFVFTTYYTLLVYAENLVIAGKLPHYIGAWLPTISLGIFTFFMFRKENRR
ncbi:MAG: LptF/LptG family permease [Nitrospirota bacterium]